MGVKKLDLFGHCANLSKGGKIHLKFINILLASMILVSCSTKTMPAAKTPTQPTPGITVQPTRTTTATSTATFTRTPSPTPTLTPTITPTIVPVSAGTVLPPVSTPIIELSLNQMRLLAEWGRGRVDGLAWSPTGGLIAVSTPLGVYLYSPADLNTPLIIHTQAAASRLGFSADGRYLAVDTSPGGNGVDLAVPLHSIQVWDIGSAEPEKVSTFEIGGRALALAFHENDLFVLSRSENGSQFQRWDFSGAVRQLSINLLGGETAVEAAFSGDLKLAATRGNTGPVRIWRIADGINLATTRETISKAGPLAFSPDSRFLAVGYPDNVKDFYNSNLIKVWRVPDSSGPLS
ncbi:MAG: WD40 repeat domain-containing protein, partial [Anaerolineaceae bacterium]|nr:WD40 repeat domain-containing protein [Anaerolineaceae bacterium]